jgi:hypothetical protein
MGKRRKQRSQYGHAAVAGAEQAAQQRRRWAITRHLSGARILLPYWPALRIRFAQSARYRRAKLVAFAAAKNSRLHFKK